MRGYIRDTEGGEITIRPKKFLFQILVIGDDKVNGCFFNPKIK